MKKNKAFTLIELLVVIVIIGILATVSNATFSGSIEKAKGAQVTAAINTLSTHFASFIATEGETKDLSNVTTMIKGFGDFLEKQDYVFPKNGFFNDTTCVGLTMPNVSQRYSEFYAYAYAPGSPNNVAIGGNNKAVEYYHNPTWGDDNYSSYIPNKFAPEVFDCVTDPDTFSQAGYSSPLMTSRTAILYGGEGPEKFFIPTSALFPLILHPQESRICHIFNLTSPDDDRCTDQDFVEQ